MANNERISLLMDGQSEAGAWLTGAARERDEQETWSRYHLIGDALRDELPPVCAFDLADRVSAALADEPTILAPRASRWQTQIRPMLGNLLRQGGQFAIAASVAAVTILGVRHYQLGEQALARQPAPVLNTIPVGGIAAPVSINYQPTALPEHMQQPGGQVMLADDQARLVERERINAFLRDHQLQQRLHRISGQ